MKIDLHLHSHASTRPSQWILQKIGAPESFSQPEALYRLALKMGMNAFTLTDHNTINGVLEVAHLPGVFISEEVTTYFPEDGCKIHVLVWNIDEAIHRELQKVRPSIYDLVAYLRERDLLHAVAHPLYSINDRLSLEHFEKLLLLFNRLELNGARDEAQNQAVEAVTSCLTPEMMAELAERHGLEAYGEQPWQKTLVAGSDDHSSLNLGRRHTEVPGAEDLAGFMDGLRQGRCQAHGLGSSPRTLAHNLYGIAYQFFNSRFNLQKYVGLDYLVRYLDHMLRPERQSQGRLLFMLKGLISQRFSRRSATGGDLKEVIRCESERVILADPELMEVIRRGGPSASQAKEDQWFGFVDRVCNQVMEHLGRGVLGRMRGANFFSLFETIAAAGSNYLLVAPYFISFGLFGRDRAFTQSVWERFAPAEGRTRAFSPKLKVAHFTDTFYEINGVARTLRQQVASADESGKDLTLITCCPGKPQRSGRVRNFKPVSVFELPEYPELKLNLPPFLQMLDHVYNRGYTYIHSATPGPMGLAALGIARVLKLPISGTYHTAIPQYAAYLTGDENIEELMWRYMLWYYDQMDKVYVPSTDTGEELVSKGLKEEKIRVYPRGVDVERFNPVRRNGFFQRRFGLDRELRLLYVGRVSKEKNLPILVDAFKRLAANHAGVSLVVVGDGPYLNEMQERMQGLPCTFTGYLKGHDLAEAYASSDLFVFPSTTDTFGNVILEAQASGLPVVVTDAGGPRENMVHGRTGLVVPGGDASALAQACGRLIADPNLRGRMGREARTYMEKRSFAAAFDRHWQMYGDETQAAA